MTIIIPLLKRDGPIGPVFSGTGTADGSSSNFQPVTPGAYSDELAFGDLYPPSKTQPKFLTSEVIRNNVLEVILRPTNPYAAPRTVTANLLLASDLNVYATLAKSQVATTDCLFFEFNLASFNNLQVTSLRLVTDLAVGETIEVSISLNRSGDRKSVV